MPVGPSAAWREGRQHRPITSETLRRNGLTVAVEAVTYTIEGWSTQFKRVSACCRPRAAPMRRGYRNVKLALFCFAACFLAGCSKTSTRPEER